MAKFEAVASMRDEMTRKMKSMEQSAKGSFKRMEQNAGSFGGKVKGVMDKALSLKTALLGFVGIKVFQSLISNTAKLGDSIDKMSLRLGVSNDFLQELDYVGGLAGSSINELQTGIRRLAKNATDAERGLSTSVRAFEDIGVSVKDANGNFKSMEVLFNEVVKGLADVESNTKQVGLAQELLGRSGTALIPILKQGSEAYDDQIKRAREMGVILNRETIQATVNYTDSMFRLKKVFDGIKARALAEGMQSISDNIEDLLTSDNMGAITSAFQLGADTLGTFAAASSDVAFHIRRIYQAITGDVKGFLESQERMKKEGSALAAHFKNIAARKAEREAAAKEESVKRQIEADRRLAEAKRKSITGESGGGGGGAGGEMEARKQAMDRIRQLEIDNQKQTFEGRRQLLLEQYSQDLALAGQHESNKREVIKFHQRQLADLDREEKQAAYERQQEADQKELDALQKKFKKSQAIFNQNLAKAKERDADATMRRETEKRGVMQLEDALISSGARVMQAGAKNEKEAQRIALIASVIQGFLAVNRALAHPPGPPTTIPSALATGLLAASNSAAIASQAFATGGFPSGRNAMVRVNEEGQEAILNAGATANLGVGGVNALNNGANINRTVTNQFTYSPTYQIENSGSEDVVELLRRDKESFRDFVNDEMIKTGIL